MRTCKSRRPIWTVCVTLTWFKLQTEECADEYVNARSWGADNVTGYSCSEREIYVNNQENLRKRKGREILSSAFSCVFYIDFELRSEQLLRFSVHNCENFTAITVIHNERAVNVICLCSAFIKVFANFSQLLWCFYKTFCDCGIEK